MVKLLESSIIFSYGQFMVSDVSAVDESGLEWTETHFRQGFARMDATVSVGTLANYGTAKLQVFLGEGSGWEAYDRVIAVPFRAETGSIEILGPEEVAGNRTVSVPSGEYRLIAAQKVVQERAFPSGRDEIAIDVFFEKQADPVISSEIIVADAKMNPPEALQETAVAYSFYFDRDGGCRATAISPGFPLTPLGARPFRVAWYDATI